MPNNGIGGRTEAKLRALKPRWTGTMLVVCLIALFGALAFGDGCGIGQETVSSRIAFSSAVFTDVNENDAKAALKVWGQTVARERGIEPGPDPIIFKDISSLSLALRSNQIDAVGMTTAEYETLSATIALAPIFVTHCGGRIDEEYVLVVHRDSKIRSIGDLRGLGLNIYQNARASLAPAWLDTFLVRKGFKPAAEFFGRTTWNLSLAKVVLPVFFRQNDACLVTRSGFETMNELNPQTGKQLKIIASSPAVVPTVFCFRASYASPTKDRLMAALRDLHTTPAGQQVLTIFHSEKLEERPASCLQSALDLLAEHRRLCAPASRMKAGRQNAVQTGKEAGA